MHGAAAVRMDVHAWAHCCAHGWTCMGPLLCAWMNMHGAAAVRMDGHVWRCFIMAPQSMCMSSPCLTQVCHHIPVRHASLLFYLQSDLAIECDGVDGIDGCTKPTYQRRGFNALLQARLLEEVRTPPHAPAPELACMLLTRA
eukprot:362875-Chlamydomonas_euryale.AAC.3